MARAESPQDQYAKNLQQSFGYPLRVPEPSATLPSSYAESGLHIGDVGYVDRNGMFEVLFNICLSSEHDIHRGRPGLTGLVGLAEFQQDQVTSNSNMFASGRVICHGIHGSHGNNLKDTPSGPCKFLSCSTSGAILILPSGAACYDLKESIEEKFCKLAEKHALEWCQFANRKSLYLVTGFYKTRFWYLASFRGVAATPQVEILERNGEGRYIWNSLCDFRQSPDENYNENQTVFISGFKIEVRGYTSTVEKLSVQPSFWSELKVHASSVLSFLLLALRWLVSSVSKFGGHDIPESAKPVPGADVNRVPALSLPFHPSDIINRYLLDKNPNVYVAITHDSKWRGILEESETTLETMTDEERFRTFLEERYIGEGSNNVVYLRRKINSEEANSDGGNNMGKQLAPAPEVFSAPAALGDTSKFIITRMRAENIVACLERMPVGFYVLVHFHGTDRESKCKPALLHESVVEWDDEVILPTDLTADIRFSIIASFEFEPRLGNGELLCRLDTSVRKLVEGGCTSLLFSSTGPYSSCISLLVTLERRQFGPFTDLGSVDNLHSGHSGHSRIDIGGETDKGHAELLRYHKQGIIEDLNESIRSFKNALELYPPGDKYHAAALFNHATATFMNCQAHGSVSDLDSVVACYRKVLEFRPVHHPDRPATLLYLAQALLYRQGRVEFKASLTDEIERLTKEIKEMCLESHYEHRAADLVLQTLCRYRILLSGKLAELDEWILEVHQTARATPDSWFDRPCRLMNLAIALRKRFEMTSHLEHLEKSISVLEEAAELLPNGHPDKPLALATLGSALVTRFMQCGDISDLNKSISMINDAVKIVPNGHPDKPWVLASLGSAIRARFIQCSDITDLNQSISMMEGVLELPQNGHFDRPGMLAQLSDALCLRFTWCGDAGDLDRSISTIKEGLKLSPDSRFDKFQILAYLGDALRVRFVHRGDIADLKSAVCTFEEALKPAPETYCDKPRMLACLGDVLHLRFVWQGVPTDLTRSFSTLQEATKRIRTSHIAKPLLLAQLGEVLRLLFALCGDPVDLDRSISTVEEGLELSPDGRFDKFQILAYLGDALRVRFVHHGNVADLKSSVCTFEDALKFAPERHCDRPRILAYLSDVLHVCLVQQEVPTDLTRSFSMIEEAVKCTPTSHVAKPLLLAQLGIAHLLRFFRNTAFNPNRSVCRAGALVYFMPITQRNRLNCLPRGSVGDLDEAIARLREAAGLLLDGSPYRAGYLANLACSLLARFQCSEHPSDLEEATAKFRDAIELTPSDRSDQPLFGSVTLRGRF